MTPPSTASAREWAAGILRQLGAPAGHTLKVTAETAAGEPEVPEDGPAFTSAFRVEEGGEPAGTPFAPAVLVALTHDDGSSVTVRLDEDMTQDEALVLLADQLQESVLESTGGAPAPRCPAGHGHPAAAELVDGVASWTCPRGAAPPVPVLGS